MTKREGGYSAAKRAGIQRAYSEQLHKDQGGVLLFTAPICADDEQPHPGSTRAVIMRISALTQPGAEQSEKLRGVTAAGCGLLDALRAVAAAERGASEERGWIRSG